ncbi:MAG: citrate lyase acyl carrier protein [Dorea sp.]|nr:citrate lyase acyl carrier protein [Dorea sp.]
MKLKKAASAGTMESSDIMVTIAPSEEEGIEIDLTSSVEKQFGRQIRKVIKTVLEDHGVESAYVQAVDKGALDCTIRARVRAALDRACKEV